MRAFRQRSAILVRDASGSSTVTPVPITSQVTMWSGFQSRQTQRSLSPRSVCEIAAVKRAAIKTLLVKRLPPPSACRDDYEKHSWNIPAAATGYGLRTFACRFKIFNSVGPEIAVAVTRPAPYNQVPRGADKTIRSRFNLAFRMLFLVLCCTAQFQAKLFNPAHAEYPSRKWSGKSFWTGRVTTKFPRVNTVGRDAPFRITENRLDLEHGRFEATFIDLSPIFSTNLPASGIELASSLRERQPGADDSHPQ